MGLCRNFTFSSLCFICISHSIYYYNNNTSYIIYNHVTYYILHSWLIIVIRCVHIHCMCFSVVSDLLPVKRARPVLTRGHIYEHSHQILNFFLVIPLKLLLLICDFAKFCAMENFWLALLRLFCQTMSLKIFKLRHWGFFIAITSINLGPHLPFPFSKACMFLNLCFI